MNPKENTKNPGKFFEAWFCILYLIFIFSASIIFFLNSSKGLSISLFGWLSLILGFGDSLHLIPRILITFKGKTEKLQWYSGLGLMISSITMTIFYIILFYIWKSIFSEISISPIIGVLIWITAILRMVLCLFPQNNWFKPEGNFKWIIYRNLPFVITGLCDLYLFLLVRSTKFAFFWWMAPAIFISFAFYLPVVLYAKKYPAVGMLMIPKTIAYIFMICLGFVYLNQI